MNSKLKTVGLPILILAVGVVVAVVMVKGGGKKRSGAPQSKVVSVDITVATPRDEIPRINASGTVVPAQQVNLNPEVTGRIVMVSAKLMPGGRVKKGELIAKIDPREYRLAIKQEESRVQATTMEFELEKGRQGVALREWEMLKKGPPGEGSALALRKPQYETARMNLESAKSGLARARLRLERTKLRAPFNAIIAKKNVDVGQLVSMNTLVAKLIGTDKLWVRVSVPVEKLSFVEIPGVSGEKGSTVQVDQRLGGGRSIGRLGEVLRLEGELDPQTRTANLLVELPNPYDRKNELPLLPGAFVDVEIKGRPVDGAFRLPRTAMEQRGKIWIVNDEQKIHSHKVEIGWIEQGEVVVTKGLKAGERVVSFVPAMPMEGMRVKVRRQIDVSKKQKKPKSAAEKETTDE